MTEPQADAGTDPRTETGKARSALVEAIRRDFETADGLMGQLIELAENATKETAGLNGLATYWRSLLKELKPKRESMAKECDETVDKLLGRRKPAPEIHEHVDQEAAAQAKIERGSSEPQLTPDPEVG